MTTRYSIRSYQELSKLNTFQERYDYLRLDGTVGERTFGSDRYLNQQFYVSREWRNLRDEVIVRDNGCDLGIPGYGLPSNIHIHHMNPLEPGKIKAGDFEDYLDIDQLISASQITHNGIHYGRSLPVSMYVERRPGDTDLW